MTMNNFHRHAMSRVRERRERETISRHTQREKINPMALKDMKGKMAEFSIQLDLLDMIHVMSIYIHSSENESAKNISIESFYLLLAHIFFSCSTQSEPYNAMHVCIDICRCMR
jgi:hypothetical protein